MDSSLLDFSLFFVTLLLALLFMDGWFRSQSVSDHILTPRHDLVSENGGLFLEKMFSTDPHYPVPQFNCFSFYSSSTSAYTLDVRNDPGNHPHWRLLGFGAGEFGVEFSPRLGLPIGIFSTRYVRFPYWTIVLTLTLLSGYLLLIKPRRAASAELDPETTA